MFDLDNATIFNAVTLPGDCHATLAMTLSASHAVE